MFRKKSTDIDTPSSVEGAFRRPSGEAMKSAPPEGLRRRVELPTGPGGPKPGRRRPAPTRQPVRSPRNPSRTATASA